MFGTNPIGVDIIWLEYISNPPLVARSFSSRKLRRSLEIETTETLTIK